MIEKLNSLIKVLNIGPASRADNVDILSKNLAIVLPSDYIHFLKYKNDFEFSINGIYMRIWGADGCLEFNEAYEVNRQLPNSLAIGDDGGGGFIMYLTGLEGFGLYYCRIADLDINEAIKISNGLSELLIDGDGIDVLAQVL